MRRHYFRLVTVAGFLAVWLSPLGAQPPHPRARRAFDQGAVAGGMRLSYMTLAFRRTPERQQALERLLEDQRDPASPDFQRWLTPEEFGARFGARVEALNRISDWLRAEGFTVEAVARGRSFVVFSGTASQVRNAFHTEIHRYREGAKLHFAAAGAPVLPREFEPLVEAIRGLDDFYPDPTRLRPLFTAADGTTHALAPGDLANIYNFQFRTAPGQTIAVAGESSLNLSDIEQFQSVFQLPALDPQTLLVGDDPGQSSNDALLEATADVEWTGAVARNATILYVYAKDVMDAAQTVIDQNLAPILSFSFGSCEANVPVSDAAAIRNLAQQANAEGITWVAASGDAGAATCDRDATIATQGASVSFPASLPEVTGVGGSEFNEGNGVYWGGPNDNAPNRTSETRGYIPETAWNDTSSDSGLMASGGGVSKFYVKPSWQQGPGVPDLGGRNVPDLSFSASPTHDPYLVLSGGKAYGAGGTSLSTPVFAGVLALTAHATGSARFGNINPSLYIWAADTVLGGANIFHDITTGSNLVPCTPGTPDCPDGSLGYLAGPGYDLVTGLGSLNIGQFLIFFKPALITTLTSSATQVTEGTPVTFTATLKDTNGNVVPGTVGIYEVIGTGLSTLGGGPVNASGTLVTNITLPPGTHSIVAYSGAGGYRGLQSAPLTIVVIPLPPVAPTLVFPANSAVGMPVSMSLSWNPGKSFASYDVYFGTTASPPYWGNVTQANCYPSGLQPNTTYYWKVVSKNVSGSASSLVWSFTTSGQAFYTISTIAGTGESGFSGDSGPAAQAKLSTAFDVAFDDSGNLYIADTANYRIRMVSPGGIISTIAGSGTGLFSGDGGPARSAGLVRPNKIAFARGSLYIIDGNRIRQIGPDGIISTIAGSDLPGNSVDGSPAITAQFRIAAGLAIDSAGTIYVSDSFNNCIRKIAAGTISTFAGQCGNTIGPSGDGGPANSAGVFYPTALAIDRNDNLYLADGNGAVRKISKGIITTVSRIVNATGLAADATGALYASDMFGHVMSVSSTNSTVLAGGGPFDAAEGAPGTSASLRGPAGLTVDSTGRIIFADGSRIRMLSPGPGSAVAVISADGLVNTGGYTAGSVAPGSIVTAFGSFGVYGPAQASAAPLPTVLSGLSLQFQTGGGIAAPLFYVSGRQVNLQIPWELAGQTSVPVSAILNGKGGPAQTLTLAPFAPGIFIVNAQGQAAVVDTSYRLVDSSNPAKTGDAIQIFCTGLGPVNHTPPTGTPSSGTTPSTTTSTPTVMIGGVQAPVLFSGLAPGAIGEYQVNVQVPPGVTPDSAVGVTISIGGVLSNAPTIALR